MHESSPSSIRPRLSKQDPGTRPGLSAVETASHPSVASTREGEAQPPTKPPGSLSDEELRLINEQARLIDEAANLTARMRKLLSDGDEQKAITEARRLLAHPNREVRVEVLNTLMSIGQPALMELAKMMVTDPDGEIRSDARDAFWNALDGEEDPGLKCALLTEALRSNDVEVRKNALEVLVFLPSRLGFVPLASAIGDPDATVAKLARDNVVFVSGEKFQTRAEAMKWFEENQNNLDSE
ncbi:MAG: HEAT repeat domain-containing protein [Opitutaceae bacterium]